MSAEAVFVVTLLALEDDRVDLVGVFRTLDQARAAVEAHDVWDEDCAWTSDYYAEHESGLLMYEIHREVVREPRSTRRRRVT